MRDREKVEEKEKKEIARVRLTEHLKLLYSVVLRANQTGLKAKLIMRQMNVLQGNRMQCFVRMYIMCARR